MSGACARGAIQSEPPPGGSGACVLSRPDSAWLAIAIRTWREVGEPQLRLLPEPLPALILFDTRCAYRVAAEGRWTVSGSAHGGRVVFPNGLSIAPAAMGVTSPTERDTSHFLAMALPEVWSSDRRLRVLGDSRRSWEHFLVGAFAHEMTHARMLRKYLPRLRALEAAIFPDTLEDNAVQRKFGATRPFAESVAAEADLLYRAASITSRRTRLQTVRAALQLMHDRRTRYFTGDSAEWGDLEQIFLDMEGAAQWAAFVTRFRGTPQRGPAFDRAVQRFRSGREFWSEDHGFALFLVLDALVPNWQSALFGPDTTSAVTLLQRAVSFDSADP